MADGNFSFQRAAWKRLKKNKGAVLGMIVIIIAIIIAVFGYFIAPDHSSYANRIVLEIGSGKPGLRQEFIKVKKNACRRIQVFSSNLQKAAKILIIISLS